MLLFACLELNSCIHDEGFAIALNVDNCLLRFLIPKNTQYSLCVTINSLVSGVDRRAEVQL